MFDLRHLLSVFCIKSTSIFFIIFCRKVSTAIDLIRNSLMRLTQIIFVANRFLRKSSDPLTSAKLFHHFYQPVDIFSFSVQILIILHNFLITFDQFGNTKYKFFSFFDQFPSVFKFHWTCGILKILWTFGCLESVWVYLGTDRIFMWYQNRENSILDLTCLWSNQ